MLKRGAGRVINIASISGMVANRGIGGRHYETTKAALIHFTRATAADWAPRGVTVNAICPGLFMTEPNRAWAKKHPEVIRDLRQRRSDGPHRRAARDRPARRLSRLAGLELCDRRSLRHRWRLYAVVTVDPLPYACREKASPPLVHNKKLIPAPKTSLTLHLAALRDEGPCRPEASREGRAVRGRMSFRLSLTRSAPTLRPTGTTTGLRLVVRPKPVWKRCERTRRWRAGGLGSIRTARGVFARLFLYSRPA